MKSVIQIGQSILFIYLVLAVLLYVFQRSLIYFPTGEVQQAGIESIRVQSGQEQLKVWALNTEARDAIIYLGGNAEDVALSIEPQGRIFPQHAVYLVNYRGYGGSTGTPTEAGLYQDAESVFDALKSRHENISVIGRSLGSGVAVHLAAVRDVHRLVVVTPYDSIEAIGKSRFPFFPIGLLIKDRFPAASMAVGIRIPVLALLAEHDKVIPRIHSDNLVAAFPGPDVTRLVIKDTAHNTIHQGPVYYPTLGRFMRDSD